MACSTPRSRQTALDKTGRATLTVKKAMGWSIITVGILTTVYAAFWHYDTREPLDWYAGNPKYGDYVPLYREKTVYWPSVIAGAGLVGGGFWLMNRK